MTTIQKTVSNEISKWSKYNSDLFVKKKLISFAYRDISVEDYDTKKKVFRKLHYLKMLLDYTYLKIYQNKINKKSSNEKLLNYFESILASNEVNLSWWFDI